VESRHASPSGGSSTATCRLFYPVIWLWQRLEAAFFTISSFPLEGRGRGKSAHRAGVAEHNVAVAQEIGDQGAEQSVRKQAELGRLLAAADGYQVVASDRTHLGRLDHVRYQRYADHPDEIVVRRRAVFPRRRRALPFKSTAGADTKERLTPAIGSCSRGALPTYAIQHRSSAVARALSTPGDSRPPSSTQRYAVAAGRRPSQSRCGLC
jgi:hypothetical protein